VVDLQTTGIIDCYSMMIKPTLMVNISCLNIFAITPVSRVFIARPLTLGITFCTHGKYSMANVVYSEKSCMLINQSNRSILTWGRINFWALWIAKCGKWIWWMHLYTLNLNGMVLSCLSTKTICILKEIVFPLFLFCWCMMFVIWICIVYSDHAIC
jgi:hypothetical protein